MAGWDFFLPAPRPTGYGSAARGADNAADPERVDLRDRLVATVLSQAQSLADVGDYRGVTGEVNRLSAFLSPEEYAAGVLPKRVKPIAEYIAEEGGRLGEEGYALAANFMLYRLTGDALYQDRYDEAIVYSYDSLDDKGLIDFLPNSATKQTALEYVAEEYGCDKGEVVFCGDSGNDIFPLTAGFSGVLVRNADEQLVENVRGAMAKNPGLKVYFAKGGFMGLNGFYTSGVIEGGYHYGVFSDP